MRDLSQNYTAPELAQKQREVADPQLVDLRAGKPFAYFRAVGEAADKMSQTLSSATLLDVGCGTAYYSEVLEVLKPGWADYTGVDYNVGMLRLAAECYPSLDLRYGDIYDLPFPDQSFDVVLSGACIMHVEDWRRAVDELKRVARVFLLLHRNSMRDTTELEIFQAYDVELFHWYFEEAELLGAVSGFSFVEAYSLSYSAMSYLLRRIQR